MKAQRLDFTAWIAISPQGQPAPFIGLAFTRTALEQTYAERFVGDFRTNGYRAVKVRIQEQPPKRAGQ